MQPAAHLASIGTPPPPVKCVKQTRHVTVHFAVLLGATRSNHRFAPMPTADETSQDAFERALKNRLHDQPEDTGRALTSREIRRGIPVERLQRVADRLDLTQETLIRVLGISERTLQRRKDAGRLNSRESDRVERLLRVWRLALRAFDNDEKEARTWLTTSKRALGGESPVEHLDTEPGARTVAEMLVVIDQTIPA